MEKLAIVVPCYNEEEVLKIASEALRGVLDDLIRKGKIAEDSFILFVNDGSKDRTWELIEEEHQTHPVQVCGVKLAGNVGHQFALTAGLITAMDLSDGSQDGLQSCGFPTDVQACGRTVLQISGNEPVLKRYDASDRLPDRLCIL